VTSAVLSGTALAGVVPPFDTAYQLTAVNSSDGDGAHPVPGIPAPYSALGFRPGDSDTLLMAGASYSDDGSGANGIYAIGVTRDANHHINGFVNNATKIASASGLPNSGRGIAPAMAFQTSRLLFYTSVLDNSLGILRRGKSKLDKHIDLSALTPTPIFDGGAMTFVPPGLARVRRLKIASAEAGHFYDVDIDGDGSGFVDVQQVTDVVTLPGVGADGEGNTNRITFVGYVQGGNPQFPEPALLVATYDFNTAAHSTLTAYDLDAQSNPIVSSARTVLTGAGFTGGTVDPETGDLLFASFYGFPGLSVLSGFTVAPPAAPVSFGRPVFTVNEAETSKTITVVRVGDISSALTVDYSTTADTAASGTSYEDVSGTLSWAANDGAPKTFSVPIHDDGTFDTTKAVTLSLDPSAGSAPPDASLLIHNQDAKPVVTLTTGAQSVAENAGTIQITATLNTASSLPVVVPFSFSGTATHNIDYQLDRDAGDNPIRKIVIPAASPSGSLNITIVDDSQHEDAETVIATMGTPVNATSGTVTAQTITIQASD
jgi:hypothetical protein